MQHLFAMEQARTAFALPMQLGECPLWHPQEAALYWIDIDGRAVHRLDPASGAHCSWDMPAEPGCIAWIAGGRMLVAMRTGLAVLDTASGALTALTPAPYDTRLQRFNDGRCDAAGRLWVGTIHEPRDAPLAVLYCVERGAMRDSGKRATVSNGLAFSPDRRTLYHADTTAHRITAYDYDIAQGSLGGARVLRQFPTDRAAPDYGGRPDGAAVDSEGAYWCAMFEGGRILRLSPSGDILREILLPVRCPTMVAFGGADLRTLYITSARHKRPADELARYSASGCVLALRVEVPGLPEPAYLHP
ncbi:MAG: SMP-30/gluconolactonase/LRE family protein [Noviherbaspirillum sp.]